MIDRLFTKEQLNILKGCVAGAEIAADIAHAHVTIYVQDEDPKNVYVYGQAQPLKEFIEHLPALVGRSVRKVEEPLVARALQSGSIMNGKREWSLGNFAKLKIYPLFDNHRKCIGVISFEMSTLHQGNTDDILMDAAVKLMRSTDQNTIVTNPNYKRLMPSDGIMVVNKDMSIIAANNTAQHIFLVLGVADLVGKRTNSVAINWPLVGMVIKTGIAESKEVSEQGLLLSIRVIPVTPIADTEQAIIVLADVTELRKKDEELYIKSVVIKEIHHRVKNNLQTIAALLRLQARRAKSEETKVILRDSINRVNSIALVHESLSQQDSGEIDVGAVAKSIYEGILASMVAPDLKLTTTFEADNALLPSEEANTIALTLNELVQNAIEHGFEKKKEGNLKVRFKALQDSYSLEIEDDGVGVPKGFDIGKSNRLGLKIIQTMVESDLGGKFELIPLEKGTLAKVVVPMKQGGEIK